MIVYRIAKSKYANDLSGNGAKIYGGRWNPPGKSMLYTSSHISLAFLEMLVNVNRRQLKSNFQVMTIEFPDYLKVRKFSLKDLPLNWRKTGSEVELQNFGNSWIKEGKECVCMIPSAVIPYEFNILINPEHAEFPKVKLVDTFPLDIDDRFIVG